MTNIEIAKEIYSQMRILDMNLVMCMGVQKLVAVDRGLQFRVNGLSFKGIVEIKLNGGDLYDISFIKPARGKNPARVLETINDVFAEDMMAFLESKVENRGN